jgi:hypothetical protein
MKNFDVLTNFSKPSEYEISWKIFHLFSIRYVRVVTFINYMAKIRGSFVQIFVHSVPKIMRTVSKTGGVSVFRLEENVFYWPLDV